MGTYIAKQMVGEFKVGDEVTGLTAKRIKELVSDGAIEVVESEVDTDDIESEADTDDIEERAEQESNTKPIDKMTVAELQEYITGNGGEYDKDDIKADLIAIAKEIED